MKEADTKLTDAEAQDAWAFYKNAARYGEDKALVKTIERYLWLRYAIEDDRERETVAHGQDAA
jgi:hypothetical protein